MTDLSHIYTKLHENRDDVNNVARLARKYQALVAELCDELESAAGALDNAYGDGWADDYREVVNRARGATRTEPADTPAHQDRQPSE